MDQMLESIHSLLGITESHLKGCKLILCEQPKLSSLEVVDIDFDGRPFILEKSAAKAWRSMQIAAASDGINLVPISGFRSYIYQKQIIERKLSNGRNLDVILTETAIPGFSEHHSGRAIDISYDEEFILTQEFEKTLAYEWLVNNANRFGFRLSYPRDNPQGIIFEPWHWYYTGDISGR